MTFNFKNFFLFIITFFVNHVAGCAISEFMCGDGHCIPLTYVCDMDLDCSDHSDEVGPGPTCALRILLNLTEAPILPQKFTTESIIDETTTVPTPTLICMHGTHRCNDNSKCILNEHLCDGGTPDCSDGSDEDPDYCRNNHTCALNRFHCKNKERCIISAFKCDGDLDCSDGSDEEDCLIPTEPTLHYADPPPYLIDTLKTFHGANYDTSYSDKNEINSLSSAEVSENKPISNRIPLRLAAIKSHANNHDDSKKNATAIFTPFSSFKHIMNNRGSPQYRSSKVRQYLPSNIDMKPIAVEPPSKPKILQTKDDDTPDNSYYSHYDLANVTSFNSIVPCLILFTTFILFVMK